MINAPFKVYGFSYECDGKQFAFDITDHSEDGAKRRIAALKDATFCGELKPVVIEGDASTNPLISQTIAYLKMESLKD